MGGARRVRGARESAPDRAGRLHPGLARRRLPIYAVRTVDLFGAAPEVARRNGNHSIVSCTPKMKHGRRHACSRPSSRAKHWDALCAPPAFRSRTIHALRRTNSAARRRAGSRSCSTPAHATSAPAPNGPQLLRAAGLPCGPERDYAEVIADAELIRRGMLFRLGDSLQVRMPLEFQTTQRATPRPPPRLPGTE